MTQPTVRARLMASSMITGAAVAALSAGGAYAQAASQPAAAPAATQVQEFVVTGSRIPTPNLTSVSPITTVNAQSIKLQGTTNVEDLINNLPQAFADFGQFESNGSTGTATVDLRGLGNTRTLVLIDGKRLQPGDPTVPVADLNFIPPALIDRVEVLTGGASAVYGSDAVAGVVNFIMKKNFEGIQIDAETSIAEHGNSNQQVRNASNFGANSFGLPPVNFPSGAVWTGQRHTVTITGGANSPDDKGNVEFYLGYTSIDPVLEAKYDWSTCGLSTNNTNTTQQYCGGSSTDATGRLHPSSGPNAGHDYDILLPPTVDANGNPKLQALSFGQYYNFAPLNYIQRPDTRYTAGEFSHYQISKAVDLYSNFMFMDDHTVAQIAGSGSFYGDNNFVIPCNDPLFVGAQGAAEQATLCGPGVTTGNATAFIGRRDVEGGGRTSDLEHMDYRVVFGSKGDIGQGWTYDISGQYGRSVLTDIEGGYFLQSHLKNALNVVTNPANGQPICQSVLDGTDKACVPYNIWASGGVTPAAINYLSGTAISSGATTEQVVTGSISGDLGQYGLKSPYATDGIGISVGAEYRREFLQTSYDAVIQSGDLAGAGGSTKNTKGSQSDKDLFGEIRIPLLQNLPFAKALIFEGGYRYSNYTSGGGNNTYKLGGDWQIVPDLRLRASYERAVRAPNVQELFLPATPGLVAGTDPCAGGAPALSAAQCYNTVLHSYPNMTLTQFETGVGLPGGLPVYGNIPQCISAQCGNFGGGNPALQPEVADTKSFGAVFTPSFFHGFSFSVDYFDITVNQAIITLPAGTLLNNCAVLANPFDCSQINRYGPQAGGDTGNNYSAYGGNGLGFINQQLVNGSSLKTRGVDVTADYRFAFRDLNMPDYGSLSFNFTGTYVNRLVTTLPDGSSYDCAGLYGTTCGTPTPKWRHQFRVNWTTPWKLTLSMNWRYLSPTTLDFNTSTPDLQNGFKDVQVTDARIPAFSYFDMAFTYKVKDRYTFRGGVNNIFDRTPPLLDTNSFGISGPAFGNANTFPQVFDPLGRVLFLGVTADF